MAAVWPSPLGVVPSWPVVGPATAAAEVMTAIPVAMAAARSEVTLAIPPTLAAVEDRGRPGSLPHLAEGHTARSPGRSFRR